MPTAQAEVAAYAAERDILAELREGLETPSQSRASRLLRSSSLRLIAGGRPEQEPLPGLLDALQDSNRTRSAAAQRLREAEALGERLWEEAAVVLDQQTRDRRGLPERPAQATKLDQLGACIGELIGAYQLALADAYGARAGKVAASQTRLSALRILEWTWRECELYRLRYQPAPGLCWQRANRVFFALLAANIPDEALPAQSAPDFLTDAQGCCTRTSLYLNLQAQGLFDPFSWPRLTQGFIARYCAMVPEAMRIERPHAAGAHLRFAHANQAGPADTRMPGGNRDLLVLDFSALATAIRADHQVFFRRDPGGTRAPERLRALSPAARRPSIRLLLRDLDNGTPETHLPEHVITAADAAETLYLSAGMTTIRALLHQVFSRFPHSHSPDAPPRARRQPLRQPKNLRTSGDPWQLIGQSARLWRVQNPGAQSSTVLSVGTLVAFGTGPAGLARPRLARIARIQRSAQTLRVDLQELACFAAPVYLSENTDSPLNSVSASLSALPPTDSQTEGGSLRALLVYDEDFGWGVLTPPQFALHEGSMIQIRTSRMTIDSKLRSVRDATEDFMLFQINPHDPRLGVPSYPRAHKARRRATAPSDKRAPVESEYRPPRF